jgi:hypothetical protein
VQELARLLQQRGEPVLAIRISRQLVLVFEQRHFYAFIMRLTVKERVYILESYLKTISYAHCRQSFFEKFRRQAPVKGAIEKIIKKFRETGSNKRTLRKVARNMVKQVDKCVEMNGHHFQHLL